MRKSSLPTLEELFALLEREILNEEPELIDELREIIESEWICDYVRERVALAFQEYLER